MADTAQTTEPARLAWLERHYEALCRAECLRQGIDPDDLISDAGHVAWELVGYQAAQQQMNRDKVADYANERGISHRQAMQEMGP